MTTDDRNNNTPNRINIIELEKSFTHDRNRPSSNKPIARTRPQSQSTAPISNSNSNNTNQES